MGWVDCVRDGQAGCMCVWAARAYTDVCSAGARQGKKSIKNNKIKEKI